MKKILLSCIVAITCMMMMACNTTNGEGKIDMLSLTESTQSIILENNKIKAKFLKENGAIEEIYNKQSKLYLTKDNDTSPLRISIVDNYIEKNHSKINSFK